ncbi:MAG: FAD-binding protein, partial [bacterium]
AALDIDANFNVLKADGKTPINGLYAVGNDSGGVLYSNKKPYVTYGGAALGWAFTSGRLAGGNAVEYITASAQ